MVGKVAKAAIGAGVPLAIAAFMITLMFPTWDFIQDAQEREQAAGERVRSTAYELVRACLNDPGSFCDQQMVQMGIDCNEGKLAVCEESAFRGLLVSYYDMRDFPKSGEISESSEPCVQDPDNPEICIPESMFSPPAS